MAIIDTRIDNLTTTIDQSCIDKAANDFKSKLGDILWIVKTIKNKPLCRALKVKVLQELSPKLHEIINQVLNFNQTFTISTKQIHIIIKDTLNNMGEPLEVKKVLDEYLYRFVAKKTEILHPDARDMLHKIYQSSSKD